jgi:antirestriction protein ArdC
MQKSYADTYERVTTIIIEGLERAKAKRDSGQAWKCPWQNTAGNGTPISLHGRPYRGMNFVLLSMLAPVYPSQLFGTYRGWQEKGAQVRKGERGNLVILWKQLEKKDPDTGETESYWYVRGFTVFAAEQVDGFDLEKHFADQVAKMPNVAERLETAEQVMAAYCQAETLQVRHGGNQAFYSIDKDFVQMPLREQFHSTEGYYATLAHELAHSTGHEKRLKREFGKRFGSDAYAFEELVAELSASMTCAVLQIEQTPREDHADYIESWLRVMKEDKKAVFTAASKAQHASDMILKTFAVEETDLEEAA